MSEYYMPAPGEGLFSKARRYLLSNERPRPQFPRAIQIQTTSRCNAVCLFCGYHGIKDDLPHGAMDEALYHKIIDECARNFVGRVSPYLMNEPLLDKGIADKVRYIHKKQLLPIKSKINTNGALLTESMSEGLIDAGLRHLWVSVQGYSEGSYKKSMGLPLGKTLENIDRFLDIRDRKGKKRPKLSITTLQTKLVEAELDYARKYWGERDVTFKIHKMDNRSGGDLKDLAVRKPVLRRDCDLFLKQAYILYNGDMVLCCHDWRRTVVLGNVGDKTIKDIWNSEKFLELIRSYQSGDFRELEICKTCMTS